MWKGESWCIDQLKCCRDYKLIVRRRKKNQREITGEHIAAENLWKMIHCCLLLSFYPQTRLFLNLFLVKTKHNKPETFGLYFFSLKLWMNYTENHGVSLKILIRFPLESCCWKNVLWVNFHSLSRAVFCMNQLPGENIVCLFCTTRLRQHLHIKLTRGRERKQLTWGERGRAEDQKTVFISKARQCCS